MTVLTYGNYSHAENEARVAINRQSLVSDDGVVYGYTVRWDISGMLHGDTDSDLVAAMVALENAYAVDGLNLIWKKGSTTMHSLTSQNTLSGTRVTSPPQFTSTAAGEMTTFRTYSLAVEADIAFSGMTYALATGATARNNNVGILLIKYEETIEYTGTGGPKHGFLPTLTGRPQKQQLTEYSSVTARQSGMAIGLGRRPVPPDPIYPDDELVDKRQIRYPTGRKRGGYLIEYPVHWSYQFQKNRPFS